MARCGAVAVRADGCGRPHARFVDVMGPVRCLLDDPAFRKAMVSKIEMQAIATEVGLRAPEKRLVQHRKNYDGLG